VDEAIGVLGGPHGTFKALAGGTDVIINLRRRSVAYDGLVNIKRIPGMAEWSSTPGQGLRIGAATPFGELEASAEVASRYPALLEAIKVIGSLQLRNMATIGGNLCNASPAADSAPALLAARANATYINGSDGPVTIPVEQVFLGPGRSVVGPTGLLFGVDVPEPRVMTGSCFQRFTPRDAMDIGIASACSQVTLEPGSGRIGEVAIALGAVAPTPMRAMKAEDILHGREPTPDLLAQAGTLASGECSPIDDLRGSASYRRDLVAVLVRRTLETALARALGA
jgi:carbon-monoxide dehydrogenase medium subunit